MHTPSSSSRDGTSATGGTRVHRLACACSPFSFNLTKISALCTAHSAGTTHHTGRLVHVLILTAGNVLDVVVYSDDGGNTWLLSETPLPHNGEAQVAEVVHAESSSPSSSSIVFNGRSQ